MERVGPEFVGENGDAWGGAPVVAGTDESAEYGTKAHHVEVVAVDDAGAKRAGFAEANDGEIERGESAEVLDGFEIGAEVVDFRNGKCDVGVAGALTDIEEAGFVAIGERAEED